MKALVWTGVNRLQVERVEDPQILSPTDVIVQVTATATCGSDLHLLGGYVPTMRAGDVIGHEFLGTVVEVGADVRTHAVGDRVVVASFIGCGGCFHCLRGEYALCDNTNPNPGIAEAMWGASPGGIYGYSHALGGFAGSHAEYVRVPFADVGAFRVPDGLSDDAAVFASDAVPTGWMGAELGGVQPGHTVAVWGAGGVGQMAARSAMLLGAEQVIVVDRIPERLEQVERVIGAETIDASETDMQSELRERTGGRGPDVCIEAVGLEATDEGPAAIYDQVKQQLRMQTDRPTALRQAIMAARKGGSVFCLGVFGGVADSVPLGAIVNKGLTLRGSQQHGQRWIPMLLERMAAGEISTEHLMTHPMSLDDAAEGYAMFKAKTDGCVRAVFHPGA